MDDIVSASGPSRYDEVRALVAAADGGDLPYDVVGTLTRLCLAVTACLDLAGSAVTLMSADDGVSGVAAASDARSRSRSELQFTTGEGPCVVANDRHRPVLVADLAASMERWPGYVTAALEAGVGSVFAFPFHVGAAGFGVLEVYADEAGPLGQHRLADALTFAQVATDIVLEGRLTTPRGDLEPGLASTMDDHAEVYQAQGMLMVALGVPLAEALVLMRSYAFSHGLTLLDVARRVRGGDRLEADDDD